MMFDDPNFAYNYIRPVAVMAGLVIGYHMGWNWLDKRLRDREERERRARNITPK
jgi:hypothetical protein